MKSIKINLATLCFLACSIPSMAQQLDRQVIASAGSNNTAHSFTIGEVIVSTSNLAVIAGFQQPDFMEATLSVIKDITTELQVYPVPTKDVVTIRGVDFKDATTTALLYTQAGKGVKMDLKRYKNEMQIDLVNLPSGYYFLTLTDEINLTIAKFKILKIK